MARCLNASKCLASLDWPLLYGCHNQLAALLKLVPDKCHCATGAQHNGNTLHSVHLVQHTGNTLHGVHGAQRTKNTYHSSYESEHDETGNSMNQVEQKPYCVHTPALNNSEHKDKRGGSLKQCCVGFQNSGASSTRPLLSYVKQTYRVHCRHCATNNSDTPVPNHQIKPQVNVEFRKVLVSGKEAKSTLDNNSENVDNSCAYDSDDASIKPALEAITPNVPPQQFSDMIPGKGPPPEPPVDCCMSGCANCVWIQYAEELKRYFTEEEGSMKAKAAIEKIENPGLQMFLKFELGLL